MTNEQNVPNETDKDEAVNTDANAAPEAQAGPEVSDSGIIKTDEATRKHTEKQDKISGVFSTQVVQKVGTGTTTRKTVKKTYWFVDQTEENIVEIQPLNVNYIPSGPKRRIPKDDFLDKFAPEPEFYVSTVYPKMQELNKTVVKGEAHREKGETFSAELEFGQALRVDENNVRANFGLGLTYLERGEDNKSSDIFKRLVKLEAAFQPEHKHLFNEFGINLRKNKMYDQAIEYYERAIKLQESDENLHYNIARVYFEKKKLDKVVEHLNLSIDMNPELDEARKFLQYLQDKNYVSPKTVSAKSKQAKAGSGKADPGPAAKGPVEQPGAAKNNTGKDLNPDA